MLPKFGDWVYYGDFFMQKYKDKKNQKDYLTSKKKLLQ